MTVHFIGAGPGAADLITVRGRDLMAACPVCLYAGSLIPAELLAHCPPGARIVNTASLSLDEILAEIQSAEARGEDVARLHSGDLSVWSAMGEQLRRLREAGIAYTVTPGENLAAFAATGAVLAIHLSIHVAAKVQAELLPHYGANCPVAIVWRASWPDETVVRTTVGGLAEAVASHMERTALILVGRSLQAEDFGESRLYAADYDRRYRPLGTEPRFPATDVRAGAALDTARDTVRDVPLGDAAP
jgi:precorrin-4/cobalt-precorrin-4 C11-methyltransferase